MEPWSRGGVEVWSGSERCCEVKEMKETKEMKKEKIEVKAEEPKGLDLSS